MEKVTSCVDMEISSEDQLQQIATISANNDIEIGKLIATAIEKVGLLTNLQFIWIIVVEMCA